MYGTCYEQVNRAQGLVVGDVVSTSYGTGPYEIVAIHQCRSTGAASLTLREADDPGNKRYWINNVRQVEDGWTCVQGTDRLYRHSESRRALQERLVGL